MISEDLLDKICRVPDENEEMEKIRDELIKEDFIITDLKKGGIFHTIIRIFVKIYIELKTKSRKQINNFFVLHADEDWLELKAADFGKKRKQAVKARGYITIERREHSEALQILKGHMFKTLPDGSGNEKKYYVLETTIIEAGKSEGRVLVEAAEGGTAYNVPNGKITVSMIHLNGVEKVSNKEGWLQLEGADIEDVEAFRKRVGESWSELAELTIEDKLKNAARKVEGVIDVSIDAQHPRGQGTTDIIVTGANGTATPELLRKVEAAVSYLKGNYDDFLCKSVTVVSHDISLTVYISKGVSITGIKEKAEEIIRRLMELSSRKEPESLYLDDIRLALKDGLPEYKRTEFTNPVKDVELPKGQIIMLRNLTVTVSNVKGA